jgi:hypothetical protein
VHIMAQFTRAIFFTLSFELGLRYYYSEVDREKEGRGFVVLYCTVLIDDGSAGLCCHRRWWSDGF